jgi:HEAT repeat protein
VEALAFTDGIAMGFGGIPLCQCAEDCLAACGGSAVPELIRALVHPQAQVRARAADALRCIGANAKRAVPALTRLLEDDGTAHFSVGCMGSDRTAGECSLAALGAIGPDAEAAVPEIQRLLKREAAREEDPERTEMLHLVVDALGGIGPSARAAVPELDKLLRREDEYFDERTRAAVVVALARIWPESPSVIPGIRRFLAEVRNNPVDSTFSSEFPIVMETIVKMGPSGRVLLPELIDLFDTCNLLDPGHRCDAAYAAARMDPGNEAAVRYLEWASRHSDWLIGRDAREKLDELRKPATPSRD